MFTQFQSDVVKSKSKMPSITQNIQIIDECTTDTVDMPIHYDAVFCPVC